MRLTNKPFYLPQEGAGDHEVVDVDVKHIKMGLNHQVNESVPSFELFILMLFKKSGCNECFSNRLTSLGVGMASVCGS